MPKSKLNTATTHTPLTPSERWKKEVLAWIKRCALGYDDQEKIRSKVIEYLNGLPDYHAKFFIENVITRTRASQIDYKNFYDPIQSDDLTTMQNDLNRFFEEGKLHDMGTALSILSKSNAVPRDPERAEAFAKEYHEQKEREEFEERVQALLDETVVLDYKDLHADNLKVYEEPIKPWQEELLAWVLADKENPAQYALTRDLIGKLPDEFCLFFRETLMKTEKLEDIDLDNHLTIDTAHKNALSNAQHFLTQAGVLKDLNRFNYFLFSLLQKDPNSNQPIFAPVDPEAANAYFDAYEEMRLNGPQAIDVDVKMPDGEEIEILTKDKPAEKAETSLEFAIKKKQEYFHNKAVDKDNFRVYMDNLKLENPQKHAFLEKESAIWRKENEKLDEITLAYLNTDIEIEKLRERRQTVRDPKEKLGVEKALTKAKKQSRKLEIQAGKTREALQKALEKRANAYSDYTDLLQFRRQQLQGASLKFTPPEADRPLAQEHDVEPEADRPLVQEHDVEPEADRPLTQEHEVEPEADRPLVQEHEVEPEAPIRERFILPIEESSPPSVSVETTAEPAPTEPTKQEEELGNFD